METLMRVRPAGIVVLVAGIVLLAAPASADAAGGRPEVVRVTTTETFADDFTREVCGIDTMTTLTEKLVIQTWPDGREHVHASWSYVSDDPRVSTEIAHRSDFYAADGSTTTITGVPLRLVDPVTGRTLAKDRGRLVVAPDNTVLSVSGPHDFFIGDEDPATYYCPSLA
jgi:hypothetical protein